MAQAHRIPSAWHDVVEEPQKISQAGRTSFVWSPAKIRIAGLVLFAAATPAAAGFTVSVPFVKWLCLAWLLGVALLMHGLSRRAADDTVVLSVDQRGILDRRLMPRHIKWQEIEAICPVDTSRSHTVDIRLRWPRTTLEQTRWSVRIGATARQDTAYRRSRSACCCSTAMSPSCSTRWPNIGPTCCTTSIGPRNTSVEP